MEKEEAEASASATAAISGTKQGECEEERVATTAKDDDADSSPSSKRQKIEKKETKTKTTRKEKEAKEDMAWICAECKEAECGLVLQSDKKDNSPTETETTITSSSDDDTSADFLICDGSCHRIFHLPCAGLTKEPPTDDDWLCQDCLKTEHACAYCGEYGKDNVNVFPCQHDQCGLFFHEACLRFHHVDYTYSDDPSPVLSNNRDNDQCTKCPTGSGSTEMENSMVGQNDKIVSDNDDEDERDEESRIPIFTCHAHHCWTCTQKDMIQLEKDDKALVDQDQKADNKKKTKSSRKKKKKTSIFQTKGGRLYRCLYCPTAYHATCIPPSARFHELAVLCHEHSMIHKLPELDINNSFQKQVESKVEKTLLRLHGCNRPKANEDKHGNVWSRMYGRRGLSTNPFFPGLRGDRFDSTEQSMVSYIKDETMQQQNQHQQHHPQQQHENSSLMVVKPSSTMSMVLDGSVPFLLPMDIKNEVYSKPPSYTHIQGNKFGDDPNNRPKKIPVARYEDQEKCACTGSYCGDDCFNRVIMAECIGSSNCNLGHKNCGNRALGKRLSVKCQPKRDRGMGWGLVTLESVAKNRLVQEYVGEVINEKEKESRLHLWNIEHPYDPNFYVMALSRGFYVDAREFANYSRFINHSCAPNCKLVSVNVKGRLRNGIYSIRDIQAGEFLTYDYNFDTKQEDRFVCRCGAPNCRGTMKGGGGKGDNETKKVATWKEVRAQYEADKAFLTKMKGKDVVRLNNGLLPGAEDHTETIARGPLEKHYQSAIQSKIFLWRNVKLGANFVSRNSRLTGVPVATSKNKK